MAPSMFTKDCQFLGAVAMELSSSSGGGGGDDDDDDAMAMHHRNPLMG